MTGKFKSLLSRYEKVTLLTHKNPDADTLGTAFGIYEILKNNGKQVEVCNASGNLPNYLDFLPHFAKIKNRIDFDNSLIISCDAGSIDLLEFDLTSREIVNIDHHKSNTNYGILNIVDTNAASASQVAYMLLKDIFEINQKSATCFYVALVTDTQNFITLNVNYDVFAMASELISYGINLQEVNRNLTQRKSLSSFRILSSTLETLEFFEDASVASMVVTKERLEQTGASYADLVGLVDYAIALATVKIAVVLMEIEGSIKVSMRSDCVDISDLAIHFGGGGHKLAAGFRVEKMCSKILLNKINEEIKKRGLLNEL